MLDRRAFILLALASGISLAEATEQTDHEFVDQFEELIFPSFDLINPNAELGTKRPSEELIEKCRQVWNSAPRGPQPIAIANYFTDTVGGWAPEVISQWPKDDYWNPLIVEFFRVTSYQAKNDLVPWCAAFVNWCLVRSGQRGSNNAGSQSFLHLSEFEKFKGRPKVGDLAIFTCYGVDDGKSVGLGHVAFVAEVPEGDRILLAGGNQSINGTSMISRKYYPMSARRTTRTINDKRTPVDMRFNCYVRIV